LAILTIIFLFFRIQPTLDIVAYTEKIDVKLAETDISGNNHEIYFERAIICGKIDPISNNANPTCGHRKLISSNFNGTITLNGSTKLTLIYSKRNSRIKIRLLRANTVGLLRDGAKKSSPLELPDDVYIEVLDYGSYSNRIMFPMMLQSFKIGGSGVAISTNNAGILRSGRALIIDQDLWGRHVQVGREFKFSPGEIINFCQNTDLDEISCNSSLSILEIDDKTISFYARVPLENVFVHKLGTSGYKIQVSWWQRLASEPVILLSWSLLGLFSFALSLKINIGSIYHLKD